MGHYSPKPSIRNWGEGVFSLWMLRIDSTFTNYQNPQGYSWFRRVSGLKSYLTISFAFTKTSFKTMTRILGWMDQVLSSNDVVYYLEISQMQLKYMDLVLPNTVEYHFIICKTLLYNQVLELFDSWGHSFFLLRFQANAWFPFLNPLFC